MPVKRRADQYLERPTRPGPATRHASGPTDVGSILVAVPLRRWADRHQSLAWPQSSDRGCKFVGPNPYTSPFNVFGPLTSCLIFGVQSTRPTSPHYTHPLRFLGFRRHHRYYGVFRPLAPHPYTR